MANIYAQLIYNYVVLRIETSRHSIADVPEAYKDATRAAYKRKFGRVAPETDPYAEVAA